jgi:hypothetical protein
MVTKIDLERLKILMMEYYDEGIEDSRAYAGDESQLALMRAVMEDSAIEDIRLICEVPKITDL